MDQWRVNKEKGLKKKVATSDYYPEYEITKVNLKLTDGN